MLEKQKFCEFEVSNTITSKLTNDFCILEKFAHKRDIGGRKNNKSYKAEDNEFIALCFAFNDEIKCHYEQEIKFFPLQALINEDHDLVLDQNQLRIQSVPNHITMQY
jgi:hypothetical protein